MILPIKRSLLLSTKTAVNEDLGANEFHERVMKHARERLDWLRCEYLVPYKQFIDDVNRLVMREGKVITDIGEMTFSEIQAAITLLNEMEIKRKRHDAD